MTAEKQDHYSSIDEAMEAVRKLNISTAADYKVRCEGGKDPRLPARPESEYASQWKGWPHFLGLDRKPKKR